MGLALIGPVWVMCSSVNQLLWLGEVVLSWVSPGSCAHPEAGGRIDPTSAPQRKAGGVDAGQAEEVHAIHLPPCPLTRSSFFFLQALDVWAMGVTLYCFVFGQVTVGVSCLLSVAGWPPWINSFLCRETVCIHSQLVRSE